jgi:preprotein translocase subunit Sec61beta
VTESHFKITPRLVLLLFTLAGILLAVAGIFLFGQGTTGL